MNATTYRRRQLARLLVTGEARIVGQCNSPGPWGNGFGDVYWIIEDLLDGSTDHVLVSSRPLWAKYYKTETTGSNK